MDIRGRRVVSYPLHSAEDAKAMNQARAEFPVTLVIAKQGELCWLGHLDFARGVERAARRSGLPLRFTEGFHKRVKMRLPEPLPLGVGSDGERFVVPLAEERSPEAVVAAIGPCLPTGLRLLAVLAGAHPEPLDVAIDLALEASDAAALPAALAALPPLLPAVGGAWEIVEPGVVRLTPPKGGRVSAGRFLELLRQAGAPRLALARIHRRIASGPIAWRESGSSLPSSPFSPGPRGDDPLELPGTQESLPCTP